MLGGGGLHRFIFITLFKLEKKIIRFLKMKMFREEPKNFCGDEKYLEGVGGGDVRYVPPPPSCPTKSNSDKV